MNGMGELFFALININLTITNRFLNRGNESIEKGAIKKS